MDAKVASRLLTGYQAMVASPQLEYPRIMFIGSVGELAKLDISEFFLRSAGKYIFFHICYAENLPSILEKGIVPYGRLEGKPYMSVVNPEGYQWQGVREDDSYVFLFSRPEVVCSILTCYPPVSDSRRLVLTVALPESFPIILDDELPSIFGMVVELKTVITIPPDSIRVVKGESVFYDLTVNSNYDWGLGNDKRQGG